MRFFSKFTAVASVVAIFGLASCGNDDNGGETVETGNPNKGETPTTPVEEKRFIEQTAVQLQQALNPQDQAEFLTFYKDFYEEFSGFIDGNDYDQYPYAYMARGVRDLGSSLQKGDLIGMTRALQEVSYSFKDIAGVYEPDFENEEWVKVGESNNLEYRFKVKGDNCALTVAPSGGEWSASAEGWMEEDEYPYDEYKVLYTIAVPRNVNVTLTRGSRTLMSGTVKNDYNMGGKTASASVDATLANIRLTAEADLNNSRCIAHAVASVGGLKVLEANGVLNGHDMCDFNRLMMIMGEGEDDDNVPDYDDPAWITSPYNIHSLFSNGSANANIMDRMFVSGTCDDMARLAYTFDNFEEEDKNAAQSQLDYINGHIRTQFYLGGAQEPNGTVFFQLQKESYSWGSYNEEYWYGEPVLKFNSDGSVYKFSEYFNEDNFASTINVFASIVDLYEAFFGLNK